MMKEKINNLKFIIQRYDGFISGTNTKGSFLLAFNTFLTGGIITNYSKIKEFVSTDNGLIIINTSLCLLLVLSVCAAFFIIRAVFPFLLAGNSSKYNYHSHIFFNSVSEFDNGKEYFNSFSKKTDDDFEFDLAMQAYLLAIGLKKKNKFLKSSIYVVYIELILIIFNISVIILT